MYQVPGLRERIETIFHYSPREFESDLNSHLGSAFSLEPLLTQSAWFRVHNRDAKIRNLEWFAENVIAKAT